MPAGLVKTPNNGKAKESLQKSAERTTSNGKKFVQTRLPFKMITPSGAPTAGAAAAASSTSSSGAVVILDEDEPPVTREPRKRKLSYDDETPPPQEGTGCSTEPGLLRRSNSKENLNLSGAKATKKVKTTEEDAGIIDLNDDDENEDDGEVMEVDVVAAPAKKPKAAKDTSVKPTAKPAKSAAKGKPEPKEKGSSSAPIQIKWPLANKRPKRRKSLKKAEDGAVDASPKEVEKVCSESSDDIEELNPQKKPKVQGSEEEKSQKEDQEAVEQKDKVVMVVDKPEEDKKKEKSQSPKETKKTESTPSPETSKKEKKIEKEATAEADISVILSSSEGQNSSSDHEMDVDTEAAEKADAPLRKSLPESTIDAQKTLTPKQQRLLEQRRKAREEKEQKLAEERRLKQQEKEQREQQKKNEREQKEQQRKLEREEKEQQKKVEREEKERKRQAEVDSKNEEKRKRNEAKEEVQRKKDEERRKKELEREEAEQKKKRAAESFTKFFVPKQPKSGGNANASFCLEHEQSSCDSTKASSQTLAFRPFQIKDDMLLAPVTRASLRQEHRSQLDGLFKHAEQPAEEEDSDADEDISRRKPPSRAHLYLSELSSGRHKPLKMLRDTRLQKYAKEEEDDDVQVIDDLATAGLPIEEEQPKLVARMRTKYLHFADNRRPPYYGTWRKKSQTISARRPLAHDKVHFDYELDSDCEWEEEEPGESLSASEDEKEERESEEESEEEYNEWYVPHGHLSDEELQNDSDGDDGHTREAQKAKLQVLQQEFAQEMKKQTKKIKPRLLGPVWLDENGNQSEQLPAIFAHTIGMYACWSAVASISLEPPPEPERDDQAPESQLPLQLDERLLQQLVRLTHGNRNSKAFLINEYLEYLKTQTEANRTLLPAKTLIREKIDELASWKPVELSTPEVVAAKKSKKPKKRLCWIVTSEMLQKFQLQDLTLQNQWDYTLTPKVSEAGGAEAQQHELSPPADASPMAAVQSPATISASTPATNTSPVGQGKSGTKKRATLLMSVPRDQPIPSAAKNALISQFLRRQTEAKEKEKRTEQEGQGQGQKQKAAPLVDEDVVMLSD
ncbi:hypothetical protein KR032_006870 [Drosophila birchii]|nr:hypothetical protein KR032_006870 [Drosophila birchii]